MANQMTTHDAGAAEHARDVVGTTRDEARSVVDDARQEASAVASEAASQAQNLVDETRTALRSQARQGTDRAAGALDGLGSRFRALADGDADNAGELRHYADRAGQRLQAMADRLGGRGFDGVLDDVQSFARRRPGVFLAVAAASGFAAGRLFRGAQAAESSPDQGDGSGEGNAPGALAGGPEAVLAGPERGPQSASVPSSPVVVADPGGHL